MPPEWLVKLRQAQTRDGDAGAWLSWEEVLALRDGRLTDRLIVAVEVLDAHGPSCVFGIGLVGTWGLGWAC